MDVQLIDAAGQSEYNPQTLPRVFSTPRQRTAWLPPPQTYAVLLTPLVYLNRLARPGVKPTSTHVLRYAVAKVQWPVEGISVMRYVCCAITQTRSKLESSNKCLVLGYPRVYLQMPQRNRARAGRIRANDPLPRMQPVEKQLRVSGRLHPRMYLCPLWK